MRKQSHSTTESAASERAVLGAIMVWPEKLFEVSARLIPADFGLDSHRLIFQRMLDRANGGLQVDGISISESLRHTGHLAAVGGDAYVSEMWSIQNTTRHIAGLIDNIVKSARQRNLALALERATASVQANEDPDAVIGELEQELIDNLEHGAEVRNEPLDISARKAFEEILKIKHSGGECVGHPSGLKELDRNTTGFRNGEVTVVGARPGQGKSWFMCQVARENCKKGTRVGIFSLEMRRSQLLHRLACQESGVSFEDIRDARYLSAVDENRLGEAYEAISKWPLDIDDSTALRRDQLTARARLMARKGAELLLIDYLQRITGERGEKLFEAVTAHSLAIAELAKSTNRHVIALSQLRRNGDEEPTLEDLRQSGQIEQDADVVVLIHRPKEGGQWTHKDKFIIGKNRSGVDGQYVRVFFDGEHGLFRPGEWR